MAGRGSSLSAAFVKRQNGLLERRGRANATGTQRRVELWSEEEASGDHVNEDDVASVLSSTVSGDFPPPWVRHALRAARRAELGGRNKC